MAIPTRRERLRTATVSEIKDGARHLLVNGGPQAISLRAIARDMGMTAPAIYRYFPSLEALVLELINDLFDELRGEIEASRGAAGAEVAGQILAMARTFRHWSVQHPSEFALMFGTPFPGITPLGNHCGQDLPGGRFSSVFMPPFIEMSRRAPFAPLTDGTLSERLIGCLEPLRQALGDVPIEVAYAFLSGWTLLYGLVAMEVFNHLHWAVSEPEALFEAELASFFRRIGSNAAVALPATTAVDSH